MIIITLNAIYQMPTTHDDDINGWLTVKRLANQAHSFSYRIAQLPYICFLFFSFFFFNLYCIKIYDVFVLGNQNTKHNTKLNGEKRKETSPTKRMNTRDKRQIHRMKSIQLCTIRTVKMHSKRIFAALSAGDKVCRMHIKFRSSVMRDLEKSDIIINEKRM